MRKTTDTTNTTQQPATKRSKPAAPAGESAAHRPTDWTQLSFDLNVMTWKEEYKLKKKGEKKEK